MALGRFKEAFTRLAEFGSAKMLAYLGIYRCRVVSQTNQTLDLLPDDPDVAPVQNVPMVFAWPGLQIAVPAGARAFLFFVAGSGGGPKKPRAIVFEDSDGAGAQPIARKGDTVDMGTFGVSGLIFQWTPPGGGVPVNLFTLVPGTGGASLTPGPPPPGGLTGKVSSGSQVASST